MPLDEPRSPYGSGATSRGEAPAGRGSGRGITAPPDERDVARAVWAVLRRCSLWSLLDEGRGPGFTTRVRLSDAGIRGAHTALRGLALRPRMESD